MAGPHDSPATGAQEVLPPKEPLDVQNIPSEAREELPGSRRHLSKASLPTRCKNRDYSRNVQKNLASMPWDLEMETHTKNALHLL